MVPKKNKKRVGNGMAKKEVNELCFKINAK